MRKNITQKELYDKALILDLEIQHDCGGYRIIQSGHSLFPEGGICPTATRRDCMIWLEGFGTAWFISQQLEVCRKHNG
jgi:hypothetical protein